MTRLPPLESDISVAPLAPRRPNFPSSTELTDPRHYAGGVPIRAIEGDLQCIIPPWGVMGIGDTVDLFWQSLTSSVATKTIQFDYEVNQQVVLWVPKNQVLDGDAMPVFYRVKRRTQAPEDSEPKETYLVKTTRPGGYDDSPEPGHSGFRYRFLTDISGGVDADLADRGVQMLIEPYDNMTAFDRIVCRWGSQEVMHYPVTQAQVDDPVNNPIVVTFARDVIERAGDGLRVVVTYQVIDCVGNYPDERDPWAPFSYVLVDLGGNRLDAPLVLVAGRPTNSIDLGQLGDNDVVVRVYTNATDFEVDDSVQLTWTGTPAQGSPVIVGPLVELVDFVPFQLDFVIPNAAVKAIAQGFATVSYVRMRNGEPDRPSKNASVNVQGNISRLPAPSVAQAPGGTLPPNSPYASISVPYFEGRKPGDLITIHCQGRRPGGGETYYSIPIIVADGDGKAPITRDLPGSQIAPLDGGTLKIYYVVANDDLSVRSERESLPLELNVGVAAPDYEAPDITEADGDMLLPEKTPNGANVIAPFNVPDDTQAGDIVGLRWVGSITGAHPQYEIPLTTQTARKPVPFFVRPEHIHPNLNGTVTVDYYRKRADEVTRFSRGRVFSVGVALELKAPSILQAPNGMSLDPVAAKDLLTAVVDYDGMAIGDRFTVTWTGGTGAPAEGTHTTAPVEVLSVGPKQVPLPNSVVAFNLGKTVTVTYSVTRGGSPAKPSLPLLLNVLNIADQSGELPTPTIGGVTGSELNVSQLQGNEILRVEAWLLQQSGQRVWLEYEGTLESGAPDKKTIWEGPAHNMSSGLQTLAPIEWLRSLKDGSGLTVTFMVNFDKVAGRATAVRFPVRTYTVRAITLNPPTLVAPATNPIDVLTYGSGVTVRVTFAGNSGDKAQLKELNPAPGAVPFPEQDFSGGQSDFTLSPAFLAARQGRSVELKWALIRGGASAGESLPLVLTVNRIAEGDTRLPMPTITAVTDGATLDLSSFTGNTRVLVSAWPGIAVGQRLWMRCEGSNSSGTSVMLQIHQGVAITSTANQEGEVTRAFLDQLADGSEIKVFLSVNFDGVADEATAVGFPLRTYTVKTLTLGANKSISLPNLILAEGRPPVNFPQEAIFTQTASGGRPPYIYTSANSAIASVTSQGGTVTCRANGSTNINVRDANGTTAFYTVSISGIKTILRNDSTFRTWPDASIYCQARGRRLASLDEMLKFYTLYAKESTDVAALLGWPIIQSHPHALFGAWLANGSGGSHYYFNLTGTSAHGSTVPYGLHADGNRRPTLCLI